MTLRRNVGIVFALAVGIALGYAVRPAAQGAATDPPSVTFSIESGDQGRIRITMPDSVTTTRVVEDTRFRMLFTNDLLIITPLNRTGATVQPEVGQMPAGFAFRLPPK